MLNDRRASRCVWRLLPFLAAMALLGAACADTSAPDADDAATAPDAAEPAAETAPPETAPPTTTTAAPPTTQLQAGSELVDLQDFPLLAVFEERLAGLDATIAERLHAYDTGGLEAVAALTEAPGTPSGSFEFVTDGSGEIILDYREEMIGASIVGELGRDMYGYPWHERFAQVPPDGEFLVLTLMNRRGSDSPIAGLAGAEAGSSVFDDWRDDLLMYRLTAVVSHDGYRFAFVGAQLPAVLGMQGLLEFSAFLIASGLDLQTASDTLASIDGTTDALVHAGRWHNANSDSERFVGFVADNDGVVEHSRFDPSTVGERIADMLGPDAFGAATAEGDRYVDDSRGADVMLLSTPQGHVVGGGVASR